MVVDNVIHRHNHCNRLGFSENHYDKGQENNKVESMFKLIIRT